MRSGLGTLVAIIAVVGGALVATLAAGWRPLLGIDLTGGVEVVLIQTVDPDRPEGASTEEIDQAVEVIRNRVDGLNVAQPDITRQGERVVIQLPDVDDQDRAIELVGQTAELQFRPVLQQLLLEPIDPAELEVTPDDGGGDDGSVDDGASDDGASDDGASDDGSADDGASDDGSTDAGGADSVENDDASGDEESLGIDGPGELAAPAALAQTEDDGASDGDDGGDDGGGVVETPPTLVPPDDGDIVEQPAVGGIGVCEGRTEPGAFQVPPDVLSLPDTTQEENRLCEPVVLSQRDSEGNVIARYLLGPAFATGRALEGADAGIIGVNNWAVFPTFKGGEEGIDYFNAGAEACFNQTPACPTGQIAVVLDNNIQNALGVQTPLFERDSIQISGSFTEQDARDTALVLRYGALPVEFEQERARSISSTLGSDNLRAGVISGIIGLILVAGYMIFYYRLLGVAALLSLAVSGSMLWVLLSLFSETGFLFDGVTLTVAGVVGLIVSIGVSLDSNVVYFETLKEDIINGRTRRSAVDRAFGPAFRTVFWANLASIIGAVILYWITSASVREFALMLGLASVLDLVATYFFLRPLVHFMASRGGFESHPGRFGLPADLGEAAT